VVQALGNSYHRNCFRCSCCNERIDDVLFTVDADKHLLCLHDYYRSAVVGVVVVVIAVVVALLVVSLVVVSINKRLLCDHHFLGQITRHSDKLFSPTALVSC